MEYFPLLYRQHTEERYLIWIGDDTDSVVVDAGGFVPSFPDIASLQQYADLNHYSIQSEEPRLQDLDWIVAWIVSPVAPVDCCKTLTSWNLFTDIAASIPSKAMTFKTLDSQLGDVYEKLFWGNNLPAVTPEGERYIPEWSPDELIALAEILTAGLDMFVACIRSWP